MSRRAPGGCGGRVERLEVEDDGRLDQAGAPAWTQVVMSVAAFGSLTSPSHTGRPPARRPSAEGWTTMTLACSQVNGAGVSRDRAGGISWRR